METFVVCILSTLFLTAVCLLGVVSESHLDEFLTHFETLDYPAYPFVHTHRRTRRSIYIGKYETPIYFPIIALGRNLTLVLRPDSDLISSSAGIKVGSQDYTRDLGVFANYVYSGNVQHFPDSNVFGSIVRGIFRGTILLDRNSSDAYYVEPAGRYFNSSTPFHSVIYHESHVKYPRRDYHLRTRRSASYDNHASFCGLSDPSIVQKMTDLARPIIESTASARSKHTFDEENASARFRRHYMGTSGYSDWPDKLRSRSPIAKRAASSENSTTPAHSVCELHLQSDTLLWDMVMQMSHVNSDKELAIEEIISIFTQHVQTAQRIFKETSFRDHSGKIHYFGINFRVLDIRIGVSDEDCPGHSNPKNTARNGTMTADAYPFCAPNIDATNLLNLHSRTSHDSFCLAYLFTYRDFSGGTLGLAWLGGRNTGGGICRKFRSVLEGSHTVRKSLNTGLVTLLNYGRRVPSAISELTFVHELGHSFGADHDNNHAEEPYDCLPMSTDPKGYYLMFANARSGTMVNNKRFSACSRSLIAEVLRDTLMGTSNCFQSFDDPFCGNRLIEEGEECDCGVSAMCKDKCCHSSNSDFPCKLKQQVQSNDLTLTVRCSPTVGGCCTHDCQYHGSGHVCQSAGECHEVSTCTGDNGTCPSPPPKNDGILCQHDTLMCKQGQCIQSRCESLPGWVECSPSAESNVTPEILCFLACRLNQNGSSCISTYALEQSAELRMQYPQLVEKLLTNGVGVRFQPGTPCDNYRGYCDFFHRCLSVEDDGPLVRLHNLLFSPKMLLEMKIWITTHWWAVILMIVSAVVVAVSFVKLFAYNTPQSRHARPPPRHHLPGGVRQPRRSFRFSPADWAMTLRSKARAAGRGHRRIARDKFNHDVIIPRLPPEDLHFPPMETRVVSQANMVRPSRRQHRSAHSEVPSTPRTEAVAPSDPNRSGAPPQARHAKQSRARHISHDPADRRSRLSRPPSSVVASVPEASTSHPLPSPFMASPESEQPLLTTVPPLPTTSLPADVTIRLPSSPPPAYGDIIFDQS